MLSELCYITIFLTIFPTFSLFHFILFFRGSLGAPSLMCVSCNVRKIFCICLILNDYEIHAVALRYLNSNRLLQGHKVADSNNDGGPQFAEVFVVVWVGSFVITINSKLLGGQM